MSGYQSEYTNMYMYEQLHLTIYAEKKQKKKKTL